MKKDRERAGCDVAAIDQYAATYCHPALRLRRHVNPEQQHGTPYEVATPVRKNSSTGTSSVIVTYKKRRKIIPEAQALDATTVVKATG